MAKDPLEGVSWEGIYQGKPCYSAQCDAEVLIISQDKSLPVADAVPRLTCELTDDDKKQLERLKLPQNSWNDDASIMAARYALDKRFTMIQVEGNKPGERLYKTKVQQIIRNTMKASTKPALSVRYVGPGKRNTGDWCFEDGLITFSDIAELYMQHFKGKIFGVLCDCSYSGSWVKACAEFLDMHGVQPCGHSAKAKGILISVKASCKDTEIPYRLLGSIRVYNNDKNTGALGSWGDGWEVTNGQHIQATHTTLIRCANKSIDASCTLESDATWIKLINNQRIYLVRGSDKGRPAWHYVQLVDDEETVRKFTELTQGENAGIHTINMEDYGQVLKSGWGKDPPNNIKDWMQKNYGAS